MSKKYKLVIFDLDGTLADTSEGIYNAHRYTAGEIGIILEENSLNGVIGGELLKIYKERFWLEDDAARKAVDIYRLWYQEKGIFQAEIYQGIIELLTNLKSKGTKLAVATLKREDFAKKMLEDMGIAPMFEYILGMDAADTLNKEKLLRKSVELCNVKIEESVLIGDSMSDAKGASACAMDFVGVTYGFGFSDKQDIYSAGAIFAADTPNEVFDFLK